MRIIKIKPKYFIRTLSCVISLSMMFPTCAHCADLEKLDVLAENASIQEQWVNWYPANQTIHDETAELAHRLKKDCSYSDLPQVVHDWICDNIFYDLDAYKKGTYSALQANDVLKEQKAVCEGIANLVQELLLEADIPCIKVWGVSKPVDMSWIEADLDVNRVNHTWNEFFMDGQWHTVDCTMDMKNRYENGLFTKCGKKQTYFDPDIRILSITHRILYRGNDIPNNVPSEWAKHELTLAVERDCFDPAIFTNYDSPITRKELCALLGCTSEEADTMTRAEAAEIISTFITIDPSEENFYSDLTGFNEILTAEINTLHRLGIMRGTGEKTFSPNSLLTRQEAIIIAARLFNSIGGQT